jgi:hypothetical protein
VIATAGNPTVIAIAENVLGPGSGRVVLFSDAGIAAQSSQQNDGLLTNAVAYVAVPETSTFSLLGAASIVLFGFTRVRRRWA